MRLPQALSHSMQSAKLPLAAIAASQMERSRRAEVRFSIRDKHEVADDRRLLLKVGFRFIDVELKLKTVCVSLCSRDRKTCHVGVGRCLTCQKVDNQ